MNADLRGWDKGISHKEAQKAQKGMRDQILPFVLLVFYDYTKDPKNPTPMNLV